MAGTTRVGEANGQVDGSTGLFAELKVMLGGIGQHLEHNRRTLEHLRKLTVTPVSAPVQFSGIYNGVLGNTQVPAAGPLLLTAGGPEIGRKWIVRNLSVTDAANPSATVAGTAQVFVGQAIPPSTPGNVGATWVPVRGPTRWGFPVLPNWATFGSNELPVLASDNLYIVLYGGMPTQSILAAGIVDDFALVDSAGVTHQTVEV